MIPVRPWMAAAFLLSITFIAYTPVIRTGGFIWDDEAHVTENPLLHSAQGLLSIWTKVGPMRGGTQQYYPLTYSVFWAEYQLFQLNPLGYHLVNILLHALNAFLLWLILRRLRVPGALLAAAIFAVHPVHVESVAWISELKNVLSGMFYLSALLCYLRFQNMPGPESPETETSGPHWRFYFPAIVLFLCALAGKTVTASLPAVILLILWWKRGHIGWKDILLVSPMFLLGAGAGLLTAHMENHHTAAGSSSWTLTSVEHCLLAGRIPWFYLGKLAWPLDLAFIYPRWKIDSTVWQQYLFPLTALMAVACLWLIRERTGKGPLAATLFFLGTLTPVLGFLNVYPMSFSYVADHFQYLASLGPIILFSAGWALGWARLEFWIGPGRTKAAIPLAGALLLVLGVLTWRQGGIYKNSDQVWIHTLNKNPDCWLAHNNLAASLVGQGKIEEAISHHLEALRIDPNRTETYNNLGDSLLRQGNIEEAIAYFRRALQLNPNFADAHSNCGLALYAQGKTVEAAAHFREAARINPANPFARYNLGTAMEAQGRLTEAISNYRETLRLDPNLVSAHNSLGGIFLRQGKFGSATLQYREALKITPGSAHLHNNLGSALAAMGRTSEAISEYTEALRIDPELAQAHNNLGYDLTALGNLDLAIAHYREALRIDPNFTGARHNLCMALARQGNMQEALQCLGTR